VYSDRAGSIGGSGQVVSGQAVSLSAGWNLVGFPDAGSTSISAGTFLSGLLQQTSGCYAEIDGYKAGAYTPSAFDQGCGGLGLIGNFTVQAGQGYFVYTDRVGVRTLLAPALSP